MNRFIISIFLIAISMHLQAQDGSAVMIDSVDLFNAMHKVKTLQDSAKVDLLNDIATRTGYILSHETRVGIQYKYATEALEEANRIHYKAGIAMAMMTLSVSSFYQSMNMPGDSENKKQYFAKALAISKEINDHRLLGWCYYNMSGMPEYSKNNNDTSNDYLLKSASQFLQAGKALQAAEVTNWISDNYSNKGDYQKAFDYAKKALDYANRSESGFALNWKQFNVQYALNSLANLYVTAGDYETALSYIRENASFGKKHHTDWNNFDGELANLYCSMGRYDTALAIANRMDTFVPVGIFPGRSALLGEIYLNGTKEYDKAIKEFKRCHDTVLLHMPDTVYSTARWLIRIGQAYDGKKEYQTALGYAQKGMTLLEVKNNRPEMMYGYKVLSGIYHHLDNNDSAYKYLEKYNGIKDSIQTKQFLLRIYNSKQEADAGKQQARLLLLDKDNKLKGEQLRQQSQQKNFLLIFLLALGLTGFFAYRTFSFKRKNERLLLKNALTVQQLESEKQLAELRKKASDLRMQALRTQMNPHFIFNSLSSINWFIMENDKDVASDYLTRFSRLMRMVLNAQQPTIPLEDELKMLQLYLDLERLRFDNSFDYSISFTNAMDAGTIAIPPMLLQPFCENAIWHGFMNKKDHGHININIRTEDDLLECTITDNGIGRQHASALRIPSIKKEKSFGLEITRERLSLFAEENNAVAMFKIEDLSDEKENSTGTRVILTIQYKKANTKAA